MEVFFDLLGKFGFPTAIAVVLLYFVLKTWNTMSERLNEVETYQKTKLENLVVENTKAMVEHKEATNQQTEATLAFHNEIRQRPCLKKNEYVEP